MKSSALVATGIAIGLVGGYLFSSLVPLSSVSGVCPSTSKPFSQITEDEAQSYTHNYTPDEAIQPTTAFMLTNDLINAIAFVNDSLREAGLAGAGVRVYFASYAGVSDNYDSFVAIGVGDDGKDVPSTNSQNLFVKREPNTTIDPCPVMCDKSSPLNH